MWGQPPPAVRPSKARLRLQTNPRFVQHGFPRLEDSFAPVRIRIAFLWSYQDAFPRFVSGYGFSHIVDGLKSRRLQPLLFVASLPFTLFRYNESRITKQNGEGKIHDGHSYPAPADRLGRTPRGPPHHPKLQCPAPDDAYPLVGLARAARSGPTGDCPGSCIRPRRHGNKLRRPICLVLAHRPQGRPDADSLPQFFRGPESSRTATGRPAAERLSRTHFFVPLHHRTGTLRLHAEDLQRARGSGHRAALRPMESRDRLQGRTAQRSHAAAPLPCDTVP